MNNKKVFGINLGTGNSCVAVIVIEAGKATIIALLSPHYFLYLVKHLL